MKLVGQVQSAHLSQCNACPYAGCPHANAQHQSLCQQTGHNSNHRRADRTVASCQRNQLLQEGAFATCRALLAEVMSLLHAAPGWNRATMQACCRRPVQDSCSRLYQRLLACAPLRWGQCAHPCCAAQGCREELAERLGRTLSTAPTPLLCNNPSCSNLSGPCEL